MPVQDVADTGHCRHDSDSADNMLCWRSCCGCVSAMCTLRLKEQQLVLRQTIVLDHDAGASCGSVNPGAVMAHLSNA